MGFCFPNTFTHASHEKCRLFKILKVCEKYYRLVLKFSTYILIINRAEDAPLTQLPKILLSGYYFLLRYCTVTLYQIAPYYEYEPNCSTQGYQICFDSRLFALKKKTHTEFIRKLCCVQYLWQRN